MKQDERERQIAILLDRFDFKKVHKAMLALGWTWMGRGVPTVQDLRRQAGSLLFELDEHSRYLSTGGFTAYWAWKNRLGLEFHVDYQEIDEEDI